MTSVPHSVPPLLPSGWKREFDAASQRYYYWNMSTNETTWSLPQPVDVSAGKEHEPISLLHPAGNGPGHMSGAKPASFESSNGATTAPETDPSTHRLNGDEPEPEVEDGIGDGNDRNGSGSGEDRSGLGSPRIESQYFWKEDPALLSSGLSAAEDEVLTVDKHFFSLRKRRENVVAESVDYPGHSGGEFRMQVVPKSEKVRKLLDETLKQHFLFQSLTRRERLEVVDAMCEKRMESGYCLIKQGDQGDFFYVVENGEFEILKKEATNENNAVEDPLGKPVGKVQAGSCFGELALLYGRARAATIRSLSAATVWSLDRLTFRHILQSSSQHDLNAAKDALRKVPLLKALTDGQIAHCAEVVRFREFKQGEQIIRKGDVGDVFYIIQSGTVLCTGGLSIHENRESSIELRENDYFGERALLKEEPRAAHVFAVTDVSVMTIDRHAFTTILGPLRQVLDDNIRSFILQEIPVFRCLSTEERLAIFQAFTTEEFKKGEVIIRQGDVGTTFYVLRSGEAQVTQDVQVKVPNIPEPVTTLLYTLKIGDYFGEMALLDGVNREANVVATEDCTCFCLDIKSFEELLAPSRDVMTKDMSQRRRDNMITRNRLSSRMQREQEIVRLLEDPEHTWPTTEASGEQDAAHAWQTSNREAVKQKKQRKRDELERAAVTAKAQKLSLAEGESAQEMSHMESRKTHFKIQDFQGVRTLGTGTFGRVKLVRHRHTAQTFALKIQSKAKIVKYKLQQNILNEKKVMEGLNHPFINCLHQTFQDQDCLYMLLELIQGGELFSLLQSIGPRLKTHHHRFYIACVVSAFEAMHHQDILYRDLKPENLLIDSFGYLKVVDFGFAKIVKHRTYTLCGTPEYFSPELVLGKGYGKGNDVWGVGILTYEVMNGFTPFGGAEDKQTEICKKVVQARLLFPKDCYDEIGMQFVSALLQKDVVNRLGCGKYGISALKGHQWFRGLDWLGLLKQRLKAPWVPKIRNELDTSHFDVYNEEYRIPPFNCPRDKDPFTTF